MNRVRQSLRGLIEAAGARLAGAEGQGLVEYSLIIALIAIAIVGGLGSFGSALQANYVALNAAFPAP